MKKLIILIFLLFINVTYASDQKNKVNEKVNKMRDVSSEQKVLIEDIVYKLIKSGDDFKVLFSTHSGIYYLRKNSKHYESIINALEESRKNGDTVKLKADANSLDIEELVLETK